MSEFDNRVTRALGIRYPILSAPMGWVARADLVAAVSEAGGMGLVPGSLDIDVVVGDIRRVKELTDRPFGVNIPILFARNDEIVAAIAAEGVRFVTTSAGSPTRHLAALRDAGMTVYHVVPTLAAAQKAADAGVDGLVVEGSEGGGFKSPAEVSTMVLVPLLVERIGLPVIAAGGIADGASMLAALALGAEGVQMGTRMLTATESGVHDNVKAAVTGASEADTMMLNRSVGRPMRVLRTETATGADGGDVRPLLADVLATYHRGDLAASLLQAGQVSGRIDEVRSAADIVRDTVRDVERRLDAVAAQLVGRTD
jgi:enoyl-[acyl-carrier protein] reductase II